MGPRFVRVTRLWTGGGWSTDAVVAVDEGIRPAPGAAPSGRVDATLLPPLTDAHVHLGLADFATAGGGVLARVLDLGWDPASLKTMVTDAASRWPTTVSWAGTFLTAPGGYPSTRPWAPAGSVTEVADADAAVAAVDQLRDAVGATVIKVALNSQAGPVLTDEVLRAIVGRAHEAGLPVAAHVEGTDQAQRACRSGVDIFAHTPWTAALGDAELREMAGRVRWISTVDMHGRGSYGEDYTTAMDNLTRFAALGGEIIYGTDLGNAITTTDLNAREVWALRAAGFRGARLLDALTGAGLPDRWAGTATLLPPDVDDPHDAVDALPTSRPVDARALRAWVT